MIATDQLRLIFWDGQRRAERLSVKFAHRAGFMTYSSDGSLLALLGKKSGGQPVRCPFSFRTQIVEPAVAAPFSGVCHRRAPPGRGKHQRRSADLASGITLECRCAARGGRPLIRLVPKHPDAFLREWMNLFLCGKDARAGWSFEHRKERMRLETPVDRDEINR